MPMHRPARHGATVAALIVASVLAGTTGCAAPVVIDPAPYAADPGCAAVMLGIPDEVGGLRLRPTSSQATAAYGTTAMITVRCGVEEPAPSSERCVAIDTASASQDWLVTETDTDWIAVSFGRSPATEVVIPKIRADKAVSEVLAQLSPSASQADPNGLACR